MTKQPATQPASNSLELYLATLSPLISAALAVMVLSVASVAVTGIVWGFVPAPRWVKQEHRSGAKRATSYSCALVLAVAVPPVLPGSGVGLRALLGLVSLLVVGPLYSVLAPIVQAKTGIKLPDALPIKGESE
jgi:hypothetical protein